MPGIRLKTVLLVLMACGYYAPVSALAAYDGPSQMIEWTDDGASGRVVAADPMGDSQDVWQRIRNGFKLDDAATANPLTAKHEAWYAARPDYVQRMTQRSRRYLYHIVQEVDRRSMPMEIALLPMIESAFNPKALSTSAASGIWQFIPSTGRHYGLKQNHWYDGRRDFTAATHAALDYLGKLYLDFGDWQLALAAYNCGEGCVARAIQKNVAQGLPTDYASLPLPSETRHYVPKLMAIKNLVRESARFNIALDSLPNQPYFDQVAVNASLDVHSAARLAGISSDEFLALNAAFPRNLIRSDTPVNLLLPAGQADHFQRNLQAGDWDVWQPHTVQKGEQADAIAQHFGVSLARLEEHNQLHLKRGRFIQTQTILVPVNRRTPPPARQVAEAPIAAPDAHTVRQGDTLFGIARRYGLSVAALQQANPGLARTVKAGQTLVLPTESVQVQSETSPAESVTRVAVKLKAKARVKTRHYTARRGDNLFAIAERFDVSVADLKAWNPATRKQSLKAGQRLLVRGS